MGDAPTVTPPASVENTSLQIDPSLLEGGVDPEDLKVCYLNDICVDDLISSLVLVP